MVNLGFIFFLIISQLLLFCLIYQQIILEEVNNKVGKKKTKIRETIKVIKPKRKLLFILK